jgi:hypothetical protein
VGPPNPGRLCRAAPEHHRAVAGLLGALLERGLHLGILHVDTAAERAAHVHPHTGAGTGSAPGEVGVREVLDPVVTHALRQLEGVLLNLFEVLLAGTGAGDPGRVAALFDGLLEVITEPDRSPGGRPVLAVDPACDLKAAVLVDRDIRDVDPVLPHALGPLLNLGLGVLGVGRLAGFGLGAVVQGGDAGVARGAARCEGEGQRGCG